MHAIKNTLMLTRYTAWANARLFDTLARLPADVLTSTRTTGTGNMLRILNHAHVVDLIWQAHLDGKPHGFTSRNTDHEPDLETLRHAQAQIDQWYIDYSEGLAEVALNEVVHFKFVDGGAGAMTRGDILLHVVNHKTYHRGYVANMLYLADARPPIMDLPVYLRDAPQ